MGVTKENVEIRLWLTHGAVLLSGFLLIIGIISKWLDIKKYQET